MNKKNTKPIFNPLTPEETRIIVHKGTEAPFTGKYNKYFESGIYHCRWCNAPLYRSIDKFKSDCGWPSFDDEIRGAVKRSPDADGERVEIQCAKCSAHLGHVFTGEKLTKKDTRHCVNSISLTFIPDIKPKTKEKSPTLETIVLGGGCFWCTEAVFSKKRGVLSVVSGYAGGLTKNPTYEQVCTGETGHAEVIKVDFDPAQLPVNDLLILFFMVHDPTSLNKQGNDVGSQYRSIILYTTPKQKLAASKFIASTQKSFDKPIVTELVPLEKFYPAEKEHNLYFERNPLQPYCIFVIRPKLEKLKKSGVLS